VNLGSCCIAEGRHLPVIKAWSGPILPDLGTGPQGVFGVQAAHAEDHSRTSEAHAAYSARQVRQDLAVPASAAHTIGQ